MKKLLLITLLTLLGISQAVAQEYEYVPFVREGVKWVYSYFDPFRGAEHEDDLSYSTHYFTLEIKGDTTINGKVYKPVHLFSGLEINEINDTVPVYLREEDKVVYGIIPDERRYRECPIGIGTMVIGSTFFSFVKTGVEFILYDFNDPIGFYESLDIDFYNKLRYDHTDIIQMGSKKVKKYVFDRTIDSYDNSIGKDYIIEGIGFIGESTGMTLNYIYGVSSSNLQVINYMSHIMENNEIFYVTEWYGESDGINEVVADQRRVHDGNYYDLMGRAVGKDVPTVPGIYIHQGKKICVKRN